LAAAALPIVPIAPGRFSTSTSWPITSRSLTPIVRAMMSLALPAENGTMMRIGLLG
jgi:hypothetical protein